MKPLKALLCTHLASHDNLNVVDLPFSTPHFGDVVVSVSHVALNFYDTLIIQGKYQVKPPLPFSPGGEFVGVITQLGEDVNEFKVGQQVVGLIPYGALREVVAVPTTCLTPCPADLAPEIAACLPIAYGTALHALKDRAHLKAGESLVVLGAAGGTGLAAVEIGKILGAHVIACASTPEKCALAREKGADETIITTDINLKATLKQLTHGRGVNVIYDTVGAELAEPSIRSLAWGGHYLIIGFAGGDIPRIPLNIPMLKGVDLCGVHLGGFQEYEPDMYRKNLMQILKWASEEQISPYIYKRCSLNDASLHIASLKQRNTLGKIIVDMSR